MRSRGFPGKHDPPLIIDADAVLPLAVALERFEAIARRNAEVVRCRRCVEHQEFAKGHALNPQVDPPDRLPIEQRFGVAVGERDDPSTEYNAAR